MGRSFATGREIDNGFAVEVSSAQLLDVCGENGEYHTFVVHGPLFSRPIGFSRGRIRRANGCSQIGLIPVQL